MGGTVGIILFILSVVIVVAISASAEKKKTNGKKQSASSQKRGSESAFKRDTGATTSSEPFGGFGNAKPTVGAKAPPRPSPATAKTKYSSIPTLNKKSDYSSLENAPILSHRLLGTEGQVQHLESEQSSPILDLTRELVEEKGLDGFAAMLVMGEILNQPRHKRK